MRIVEPIQIWRGLTNERTGSGHVIWGPIRGLGKNNIKGERTGEGRRHTSRLLDHQLLTILFPIFLTPTLFFHTPTFFTKKIFCQKFYLPFFFYQTNNLSFIKKKKFSLFSGTIFFSNKTQIVMIFNSNFDWTQELKMWQFKNSIGTKKKIQLW